MASKHTMQTKYLGILAPYKKIDMNDSKVYPMGLTQTDGGIHVSVVAAAKACSLLLFEKQEGKNGKEARFR